MSLFFTKRGKLDGWYKDQLKELDRNYFAFQNPTSTDGASAIQQANNKARELEDAKTALKEDYRVRLKEIGQKPRSDF